ncbi:NHLP bacteriocin export ABC transporter permease/ATPase subunit [Candidatus Contubernalis alkaliaceticus]|uniref:NHLP bacteriocin export ABC transporter permease/ATPase subunit n=1 Tax=Candidatus Contubernalis alkaliaceticus TaxID=338645 RepID=UPI001F4C001E|nr:NHLP bacteriocin export ABC transporter permease/ATPase subunit [Candidatus Contubernalis alkalaceticus]UNC93201.1 NHLP bacteriocin export ABC transporter permease/ATPase subunit [Candidatus Contubernalis alkalaceticus]
MARNIINSKNTPEDFISLSSNQALLLDSSQVVWMVQEGKADVYAVSLRDNIPVGRLIHLFRAEMGQTLFGLDTFLGEGVEMGLLVTGIPDTTLIRRLRSELLKKAREKNSQLLAESAAYMVESWVMDMSLSIFRRVPPTRFKPLEPGDQLDVKEGEAFRPQGNILWIRQCTGASQAAGRKEMTLWAGEDFYPLTGDTWLQAVEDGHIQCRDTLGLVDLKLPDKETALWKALDYFHSFILPCIHNNLKDQEKQERERLIKGVSNNQEYLSQAFEYLEKAVSLEEVLSGEALADPLVEACRRVGLSLGIKIKTPPAWLMTGQQKPSQLIVEVAQASNIRCRRVQLTDKWWKKDNGPLVVFHKETGNPRAVLPVNSNTYHIYDPQTGQEEVLTEEKAQDIHSQAYMLYPSFPDRSLTTLDLLKFIYRRAWRKDLWLAGLMGILGGLLGLVMPFLTGVLFDGVIPMADKGELILMAQFLLVSALAVFFFNVVQLLAVLRVESRVDFSLQAAFWDRLMKLPLSFIQHFSAGDLGSRATGIMMIRHMISGMVINSLFSGVFSLLNFILIFYYLPSLAWIAITLVLGASVITILLGSAQARLQHSVMEIEGKISGLLLQVFGGITRFRMAGAENRAYYLWAKQFGEQRKNQYKSQTIGNYLMTFSAAFPFIASTVIYISFIAVAGGETVSTGIFLAFNAAFTGMVVSLMSLSSQVVVLMQAVPLLRRLRPILEGEPEIDEARLDPGELKGEIEVSRVTFRYNQEDSPVVDDVSLKIKAGQFAAIVGGSGSGKSTLFKMLLGFLRPEKGTVYFDGQDLSTLDLSYLRKQLGVVLQNDRLLPGSILENILGASNLTIDDAREAARMAGLAEDIQNMPMGMHTFIAEGGSTISGGQQQRMLIARAVVKKPRILLFDEATSALDNRTQSMVTQSLEGLKATRLVIAHRLSTVMNADIIYVLEKGRIVQKGTYAQLMAEKGVFQSMAKRQLA